jgi:hypothetical protein
MIKLQFLKTIINVILTFLYQYFKYLFSVRGFFEALYIFLVFFFQATYSIYFNLQDLTNLGHCFKDTEL